MLRINVNYIKNDALKKLQMRVQMNGLEIIKDAAGLIASITGIIGFIPQIRKAYKTKSMTDVSMALLLNYLACCVSWMIYGALDTSFFVLWSNVFGSVVSVVTVIQKIYYDKLF